jgi:hypothetical protein
MRKLRILNIRDISHLCKHLETSHNELAHICQNPERYYRQGPRLIKGKVRHIATPFGRLRAILDKLQNLLQRVDLPASVHGGVKEHSALTNAVPHLRKPIVLCMDIKDFFPSITNRRVYAMFRETLKCVLDVARMLTRLCTLNGSLPQGSPTSTIVAALSTIELTKRLDQFATNHNATYTQYVDDVTISGPRHMARMAPVLGKIIRQSGLKANPAKTKVAQGEEEKCVTGIRVNVVPDVTSKKMKEVRGLLDSEDLCGDTNQKVCSLEGKIRYIEGLNHGAGRYLRKQLRKIKTRHNSQVSTSRTPRRYVQSSSTRNQRSV